MDLEPVYLGLSNAQNKGVRFAGQMMQRKPNVMRAAAKILPQLRQITDYAGWPRRSLQTNPPTPPAYMRL